MTGVAVQVQGLAQFRSELRKIGGDSNAIRKVHRQVSDLVGDRSRADAPASISRAIKSRATNTSAYIEVVPKPPESLAWVLGAKRRTGWYARRRYEDSAGKQFQPWVGNQWEPGGSGTKPYFIGPAIDRSINDVLDIYEKGLLELARDAFPT